MTSEITPPKSGKWDTLKDWRIWAIIGGVILVIALIVMVLLWTRPTITSYILGGWLKVTPDAYLEDAKRLEYIQCIEVGGSDERCFDAIYGTPVP
jgi:hypothetical protein